MKAPDRLWHCAAGACVVVFAGTLKLVLVTGVRTEPC